MEKKITIEVLPHDHPIEVQQDLYMQSSILVCHEVLNLLNELGVSGTLITKLQSQRGGK